jgi:hypothetical protein
MIAGGDGSRRHYAPVVDIAAAALAVSLWMLAAARQMRRLLQRQRQPAKKLCCLQGLRHVDFLIAVCRPFNRP